MYFVCTVSALTSIPVIPPILQQPLIVSLGLYLVKGKAVNILLISFSSAWPTASRWAKLLLFCVNYRYFREALGPKNKVTFNVSLRNLTYHGFMPPCLWVGPLELAGGFVCSLFETIISELSWLYLYQTLRFWFILPCKSDCYPIFGITQFVMQMFQDILQLREEN